MDFKKEFMISILERCKKRYPSAVLMAVLCYMPDLICHLDWDKVGPINITLENLPKYNWVSLAPGIGPAAVNQPLTSCSSYIESLYKLPWNYGLSDTYGVRVQLEPWVGGPEDKSLGIEACAKYLADVYPNLYGTNVVETLDSLVEATNTFTQNITDYLKSRAEEIAPEGHLTAPLPLIEETLGCLQEMKSLANSAELSKDKEPITQLRKLYIKFNNEMLHGFKKFLKKSNVVSLSTETSGSDVWGCWNRMQESFIRFGKSLDAFDPTAFKALGCVTTGDTYKALEEHLAKFPGTPRVQSPSASNRNQSRFYMKNFTRLLSYQINPALKDRVITKVIASSHYQKVLNLKFRDPRVGDAFYTEFFYKTKIIRRSTSYLETDAESIYSHRYTKDTTDLGGAFEQLSLALTEGFNIFYALRLVYSSTWDSAPSSLREGLELYLKLKQRATFSAEETKGILQFLLSIWAGGVGAFIPLAKYGSGTAGYVIESESHEAANFAKLKAGIPAGGAHRFLFKHMYLFDRATLLEFIPKLFIEDLESLGKSTLNCWGYNLRTFIEGNGLPLRAITSIWSNTNLRLTLLLARMLLHTPDEVLEFMLKITPTLQSVMRTTSEFTTIQELCQAIGTATSSGVYRLLGNITDSEFCEPSTKFLSLLKIGAFEYSSSSNYRSIDGDTVFQDTLMCGYDPGLDSPSRDERQVRSLENISYIFGRYVLEGYSGLGQTPVYSPYRTSYGSGDSVIPLVIHKAMYLNKISKYFDTPDKLPITYAMRHILLGYRIPAGPVLVNNTFAWELLCNKLDALPKTTDVGLIDNVLFPDYKLRKRDAREGGVGFAHHLNGSGSRSAHYHNSYAGYNLLDWFLVPDRYTYRNVRHPDDSIIFILKLVTDQIISLYDILPYVKTVTPRDDLENMVKEPHTVLYKWLHVTHYYVDKGECVSDKGHVSESKLQTWRTNLKQYYDAACADYMLNAK